MANYYGITKTNYFHVNDPEGFKKLMRRVVSDEGDIDLWEDKDKDGNPVFAFGGYSSISGICPIENNNDDSEDEDYDEADYDLFVSELQKLIVDGEAIIITEIGHEKLRYITAYSTVITKDGCEYVTLERRAAAKARDMLGNQKYNPDAYD